MANGSGLRFQININTSALKKVQRALARLDKAHAQYHRRLAQGYKRLGQFKQAHEEERKAIEREAQALNKLGRQEEAALLRKSKLADAAAKYQRWQKKGAYLNDQLRRSIKRLVLAYVSYYGITKAIRGVGGILETAGDFAAYRVRLETFSDSAEEAGNTLDRLWKIALSTGASIDGLIDAYVKLATYGFKASNEELKTIVDWVNQYGGGLETINGISKALGDIIAKNAKAIGQERIQLANWGIDLRTALKEAGHTYKQTEKGLVSVQDVVGAVFAYIEKRAGGASERLAGTWKYLVKRLANWWKWLQVKVAEAGLLKEAETTDENIINYVETHPNLFQAWASQLSTFLVYVIQLGKEIAKAFKPVFAWLEGKTLEDVRERGSIFSQAEADIVEKRIKFLREVFKDASALKEDWAQKFRDELLSLLQIYNEYTRTLKQLKTGKVAATGEQQPSGISALPSEPVAGQKDEKEKKALEKAKRFQEEKLKILKDYALRTQKIQADLIQDEDERLKALKWSEISRLRAQYTEISDKYGNQLQLVEWFEARKAEIEDKYREKKKALDKKAAKDEVDVKGRTSAEAQSLLDAYAQYERATEETRLQASLNVGQAYLAGVSSMFYKMAEMNKKYFLYAQLAHVGETIMATAQAVMQAYAQAGPYLGSALAILISSLGAAKIALIMKQKPPEYAEGGIIEGGIAAYHPQSRERSRRMSSGGLVKAPTYAEIGEGGSPEIILPLNRIEEDSASGYWRSGRDREPINIINLVTRNDVAMAMSSRVGRNTIINAVGRDMSERRSTFRKVREVSRNR